LIVEPKDVIHFAVTHFLKNTHDLILTITGFVTSAACCIIWMHSRGSSWGTTQSYQQVYAKTCWLEEEVH
jgi:hypothetical protein